MPFTSSIRPSEGPNFLAHIRLLDDKPCRLVDVLLTPPVPGNFPDTAATAGFRLFTGCDEPPADLLQAAKRWLTDGSPLPPAAFTKGIIPPLNRQAQDLVRQILVSSLGNAVECIRWW